jgi:O-antigen ligase
MINKIIKILFLSSIVISSISPMIPYGVIFSNINVGDVLLVLLSPFILKRNTKFYPIHVAPLILMFSYLISSYYSLITLPFVDDINLGFILRFLYYSFVVMVVFEYVKSEADCVSILRSIYIGLVITLVIVWYEWSKTPVYLGSIPMLHTVHYFVDFPINRNYIGFFIALGCGLSLGFYQFDNNNKIHLLILFAFLMSSILTFSKGTWISSYAIIFIYFYRKSFANLSLIFFLFVLVFFIVISLDLFSVSLLIEQLTARLDGSSSTNNERVLYAIEALQLGFQYLPFGVGAAGYESASIYNGFHTTEDPHNAILWVFSEAGVLGFLAYSYILIYLFFIFSKKSKLHMLAYSLYIPIVLNIPFQGTPLTMKYIWFLSGLAIYISSISVRNVKVNVTSKKV